MIRSIVEHQFSDNKLFFFASIPIGRKHLGVSFFIGKSNSFAHYPHCIYRIHKHLGRT